MGILCPGEVTGHLRSDQETIKPLLYLLQRRLDDRVDLGIMGSHFDGRIDEKAATTGRIAEQQFNAGVKKALENLREGSRLLLQFRDRSLVFGKVSREGSQIERMLVAEGVIQTAASKAHALNKILNRGTLISLFPEQVDGFVQDLLRQKRFLSCHRVGVFLSFSLPQVYTILERKVKDVGGEIPMSYFPRISVLGEERNLVAKVCQCSEHIHFNSLRHLTLLMVNG